MNPGSKQPISQPGQATIGLRLRGGRCILLISAFSAFAAAVSALEMRELRPISDGGDPLWHSLLLLRTIGLAVVAWLLWRYSAAVREYGQKGEAATGRLESAHASLWMWAAVFVVGYLLHAVVLFALRAPL